MRYLTLLLLFCSSICFCQSKGDTKIIVTPADTSNLFNRIVLFLYESGYTLESKDETLRFIATSEKSLKKLNASMKLRVLEKEGKCIITGFTAFNFELKILGAKQERTFDSVKFGAMKGSVNRECWNEMEAVARNFGTEIQYSK